MTPLVLAQSESAVRWALCCCVCTLSTAWLQTTCLQDQELKILEQKLLWERTRAYPAIIRPQPDSFVVGDYKLELLKVSSVKRNKFAKYLRRSVAFPRN